jgi:phage major head subunit gpT-like protein
MASIMETSAWANHTTLRGIDIVIFDEWEQRPRKGREIFNVRTSTQYREDTQTAGGAGIMPEVAEGQGLAYVSLNEGFRQTFTHVDYGNGMRITRRMFREDLYGTMEQQAAELGRMAVATEETLLANHLNNGFDSGFTGADGVELFSSAHVREDGSTYANELSSSADLSQTSLEQAHIDFSDFRDGGGKRLMIEPELLVIPKELRFEAHRYLKSMYSPENDTNASNPLYDSTSAAVWHYLTDTDAWFLVAKKSDHFLLLYERETPWTDYEEEFETKDHKVSLMFSQSSGWSDPRGVFGVAGV